METYFYIICTIVFRELGSGQIHIECIGAYIYRWAILFQFRSVKLVLQNNCYEMVALHLRKLRPLKVRSCNPEVLYLTDLEKSF